MFKSIKQLLDSEREKKEAQQAKEAAKGAEMGILEDSGPTIHEISTIDPRMPVRVMVGAGDQRWEGWIPTGKEELDLLQPDMWAPIFQRRLADAFLAEHVWEHLTEEEGRQAAATCFKYLKPGGYLRVAVPDAFFQHEEYQENCKVGGPGPADHPAADHKVFYNHNTITAIFESAGFEVELLEYNDNMGSFHYNAWTPDDGPIYRSFITDHRNRDGELNFLSLILDAKKPDPRKRS